MDHLSGQDAGRIAALGRRLLRAGKITHREAALLEALLWSCRSHGRAVARASYTRLADFANVSRETVARGLRRLEALGLISRTKTRLRVSWGLGTASRQGVTIYRLIEPARTEFGAATVIKAPKIYIEKAREDLLKVQDAKRSLENIAICRMQFLYGASVC